MRKRKKKINQKKLKQLGIQAPTRTKMVIMLTERTHTMAVIKYTETAMDTGEIIITIMYTDQPTKMEDTEDPTTIEVATTTFVEEEVIEVEETPQMEK